MKQSRTFFLLLMAALMLSLSACGDDDDNPISTNSDELQGGTWTFQKASVNVMGQTIEMSLSEIRQMFSAEMGTNNIMFIDEKLKFEEEYVVLNNGERLRYKYYSDGTLWIEGMDEMASEGVSVKMKIKSVEEHQLVITYMISVQGVKITEDVFYTR